MRLLMMTLFALAACSSDPAPPTCPGAGGAPAVGITAAIGSQTYTYGTFRWGANNDCPAAGSSVISVTITGAQATPAAPGFGIGLCLPRPDLIAGDPIPLDDATRVQLVSFGASTLDGTCVTRLSRATPPTGTVTFSGFCTKDGEAYALSFSGAVPATRTCMVDAGPSTVDPVTVSLSGLVAVTAR